MGLPMIIVQMPVMVAALIPIIVIEALFVRSRLALTHREVFRGITAANLASTLLGIPIAWIILVVGEQFITLPLVTKLADHSHVDLKASFSPLRMTFLFLASFAWLFFSNKDLNWMIPVASALLLIPSYFASVWIERAICRRFWRHIEPVLASRAVTIANRISYAGLFVVACGWLVWRVLAHK